MSFSKMIVFSAMALVCLLCLVQSGRADEPDCASTPDPETPSYIRKADCKGYYMCFRGNAIEMQPCTGDLVFSMKGLTCVRPGSELDDCVVPVTNDKVDDDCIRPHPIECQAFINCSLPVVYGPSAFEDHMDECPYPQLFNAVTKQCDDSENVDCGSRKEAKSPCQYRANRCATSHCIPCWVRYPNDPVDDDCIRPHPIECLAFINCSLPKVSGPSTFEDHMDECPYPQLFNAVTNQCDDFENVDCGSREEAKSPCQYRANRCAWSHCIPCWARYPGGSCIGKEDGVNAHDKKLWTSSYVTCYKERTISAGSCGSGENRHTGSLFHPSLNGCVSGFMIPVSHSGNMPVCNGLDGALPDEFGRCNRYTICEKGVYISSQQCDDGLNFDPATKTCRSAESFCGVCGNC